MKKLWILALGALPLPALAAVTVTQPAANLSLESPFLLVASTTDCSGAPIVSMGYSFDSQSNTTTFDVSSLNVEASYSGLTLGASHTLHVKSWASGGANCTTNVAFTAVANPATTLPGGTVTVPEIQSNPDFTWAATDDSGTTGTASGTTQLETSPSLSGDSRLTSTTYSGGGGERYDTSFGSDTTSESFLYDNWVYISSSSTSKGLINLEMDMNQVTANGQTVIYGFQCDGNHGVWDYTENSGTASAYHDTWVHSTQACPIPYNWLTNTWHHVQVTYERDGSGNVTYQSVWLDGSQQNINETVFSSFALGWGSVLLTNFQIDGSTSSGEIEAYFDELAVSRW